MLVNNRPPQAGLHQHRPGLPLCPTQRSSAAKERRRPAGKGSKAAAHQHQVSRGADGLAAQQSSPPRHQPLSGVGWSLYTGITSLSAGRGDTSHKRPSLVVKSGQDGLPAGAGTANCKRQRQLHPSRFLNHPHDGPGNGRQKSALLAPGAPAQAGPAHPHWMLSVS